MSYEENVRAILQCCFSQSREDLIETAVKAIVALKPEPVVVNPVNPGITLPYHPCPDITSPNITPYSPYITCAETTKDLKKNQNPNIIN